MESGFERELSRAATIDDVLSDAYKPLPAQKTDADIAARRLAAWCRASASGDWSLFADRLGRDGWTIDQILTRFATVRRDPRVAAPMWMSDAEWVGTALHAAGDRDVEHASAAVAFAPLLAPLVGEAQRRLRSVVDSKALEILTDGAQTDLSATLLSQLSDLASPALFERFIGRRRLWHDFVADMKGGEFRRLFDDKPVLLRLLASVTRQWIDTSRELIDRLAADLPAIRRNLRRGRPRHVGSPRSSADSPIRTTSVARSGSSVSTTARASSTSPRTSASTRHGRTRRQAQPKRTPGGPARDASAHSCRIRLDRVHRTYELCGTPGLFGLLPARRCMAGLVSRLRRRRHAPGEHRGDGSHPVPIDLEMILQADDTRVGDRTRKGGAAPSRRRCRWSRFRRHRRAASRVRKAFHQQGIRHRRGSLRLLPRVCSCVGWTSTPMRCDR